MIKCEICKRWVPECIYYSVKLGCEWCQIDPNPKKEKNDEETETRK